MRFEVLGPLTVRAAGGQEISVLEPKVRALLAILLVHRGGLVPADRLVDHLWAGRPPRTALNTLQRKVSQLRRALGRDRVTYRQCGYRLHLDDADVDAIRFRDLVEQARAAPAPRQRADLLTEALALWRGPAYSEFAAWPFADGEIARLTEERMVAIEDRAAARLELGQHAAVAAELTDLVARHPLRERLRAAHIRALYGAGLTTEAMNSFHDLRRRLADELGVRPGPESTALYEAMLHHDPDLTVPQPISPPLARTNLPTPATSLVGREEATERMVATLRDDSPTRMVTLTGPGGVGKTRLALAAADRLRDRFPDGVWFVELAGLGGACTADDVSERIVVSLGLCETAAVEPDSSDLTGWLRKTVADKRMLLLLDNCEHVIDPVAAVAELLLSGAAGVRLLLTSREPVEIPGESLMSVRPLISPEHGVADAGVAARYGAVRLFVERVAAAAPDFALDDTNAGAVAAICRRLDGIPLALELVAPVLRTLTPHEVAERLDDRFNLPIGPRRGRTQRHRTLRAMIDWSWELLDDAERAVLRRLSIHADGCTVRDATTVCADEHLRPDRVPGLLFRLVDRSLVVRDRDRFRLLESVAAYGAERLDEAGESAAVRGRFVRCYLDLAEHADRSLRGPDQGHRLRQLDAETVNLRRALDISLRERHAEDALRMVGALAWYWFLRGRLVEARRSLRAALALEGGSPAARAAALGWLAGVEARTAPEGRFATPTPDSIDDVGDPRLRARLRWFLGSAMLDDGHEAAGRRLIEHSLAESRAHGDRWTEAIALVECASRTPAEHADAERAAATFRELGDRWGQLRAARAMATLAESDGRRGQAIRMHHEALQAAQELSLWTEAVEALLWLGRTAATDGDTEQAERHYHRALTISAERSYHRGEARARAALQRIPVAL